MNIYLIHYVHYEYYRFEDTQAVCLTLQHARRWCDTNCPAESGQPATYSRRAVHPIRTESGLSFDRKEQPHYWIERKKVEYT